MLLFLTSASDPFGVLFQVSSCHSLIQLEDILPLQNSKSSQNTNQKHSLCEQKQREVGFPTDVFCLAFVILYLYRSFYACRCHDNGVFHIMNCELPAGFMWVSGAVTFHSWNIKFLCSVELIYISLRLWEKNLSLGKDINDHLCDTLFSTIQYRFHVHRKKLIRNPKKSR